MDDHIDALASVFATQYAEVGKAKVSGHFINIAIDNWIKSFEFTGKYTELKKYFIQSKTLTEELHFYRSSALANCIVNVLDNLFSMGYTNGEYVIVPRKHTLLCDSYIKENHLQILNILLDLNISHRHVEQILKRCNCLELQATYNLIKGG